MKKDNLWLWIALGTVVIIAFNVFFFALSADNKPASVWINYVFITFSYIVLMLTPVLAGELTVKNNKRHLLYYGTFAYLVLTVLVDTVFIMISPESTKATWLVNIGMLACAATYLIVTILMVGQQKKDDPE